MKTFAEDKYKNTKASPKIVSAVKCPLSSTRQIFTKYQANSHKEPGKCSHRTNEILTIYQANIHKIPGKVRWTATSEVTLAAERGGGVWRGGEVLLKVSLMMMMIVVTMVVVMG